MKLNQEVLNEHYKMIQTTCVMEGYAIPQLLLDVMRSRKEYKLSAGVMDRLISMQSDKAAARMRQMYKDNDTKERRIYLKYKDSHLLEDKVHDHQLKCLNDFLKQYPKFKIIIDS